MLIEYGNINSFGQFQLVGNYQSKHVALQDPLHIAKKISNKLFDMVDILRLGNFSANYGHLIMLHKLFPKSDHCLTLGDLDPLDKMNYQ